MKVNKLVVGLTGGIGSGKSAAAKLFQNLGVTVIDADIVARKVVQPGQPALQAIVDHFGEDILNAKGDPSLNRQKLRSLIFSNSEHRLWLNNLLHPLIREIMQTAVNESTSSYCIQVIPLLLESGLQDQVDRVLVIDVPKSVQINRVLLRDESSDEEVDKIIQSQISREERLALSDDIITNDSNIDELEKAVNSMNNKYLRIAADI